MPGNTLPCLHLKDGTLLGSSTGITRYLGKLFGYYPQDAVAAAKCDYIVDTYNETIPKFQPFCNAKDDATRQKAAKQLFGTDLPTFMENIAQYIPTKGFIFGEKLSVADFWIGSFYTNFLNNPHGVCPEVWAQERKKYPAFVAYGERYAKAN